MSSTTSNAEPLLKVRTVTVFVSFEGANRKQWTAMLEAAAKFNTAAEKSFTAAGFEVQTTRVVTNPFDDWCSNVLDSAATLDDLRFVDEELQRLNIGLFNAGMVSSPAALALIPSIIALGPRISASGALADPLDTAGATTLAETILAISIGTKGGEGNFQFCSSFNVAPGTPFFPAAYGDGSASLSFALGCETSALLAHALPRAASSGLKTAQGRLTDLFLEQMQPLAAIAQQLSREHTVEYKGIDASIAPLGTAPPLTDSFESLGLGNFGESGTLAVSALVTGAVKALASRGLLTCGYTGLMLPPCEDSGLAAAASRGAYRIHDLLMYSAVCGIGLDTVPIPGDTPAGKLAALLLDVAALAFRLQKPLTARLFPVPGRGAGESTAFDHPILCDTTILAVP